MNTREADQALFKSHFFTFEYPGYWQKSLPGRLITIADVVSLNNILWEVQIYNEDHSECIRADDGPFYNAHEAINAALEFTDPTAWWRAHDFDVWQTGGGCTALGHQCQDKTDHYILITATDDDAPPESVAKECEVGNYADDGHERWPLQTFPNARAALLACMGDAFADAVRNTVTKEQWQQMWNGDHNPPCSVNDCMTAVFAEFGIDPFPATRNVFLDTSAEHVKQLWWNAFDHAKRYHFGGHLPGDTPIIPGR